MKAIESILSRYNSPAKLVVAILCFSLIVFSIVSFVYNGIVRGLNIPIDFYQFYTAGQLWNEGLDPYDYDLSRSRLGQLATEEEVNKHPSNTYYYLPHATVLFSLLAHLPFEIAHQILMGINLSLIIVSLGLLVFILSWHRPIGLFEVTLLISLLNTGFGRSNVRDGQSSLFIWVLLLAMFILARRRRKALAGLALGAATFKPQFVPLYVGYYLLRRSFRLVVAFVLAAGLFTSLPLFLTQRPLVETMTGWLRTVATNAPVGVNDPSPYAPYSAYMLHLAPLIYRVFNVQSTVTSVVLWLILFGLYGCTAYLIGRSGSWQKADLLDFGLVSVLSLLSFYHRAYDIFLLFPGLLYLYLHMVNTNNKNAQRNWAVLLVSILLLISLPGDMVERLVRLSSGHPVLPNNYLARLVAPFPTWASVALCGALLWLKAHQRARYEELPIRDSI